MTFDPASEFEAPEFVADFLEDLQEWLESVPRNERHKMTSGLLNIICKLCSDADLKQQEEAV